MVDGPCRGVVDDRGGGVSCARAVGEPPLLCGDGREHEADVILCLKRSDADPMGHLVMVVAAGHDFVVIRFAANAVALDVHVLDVPPKARRHDAGQRFHPCDAFAAVVHAGELACLPRLPCQPGAARAERGAPNDRGASHLSPRSAILNNELATSSASSWAMRRTCSASCRRRGPSTKR
jgi:hypothetical protein